MKDEIRRLFDANRNPVKLPAMKDEIRVRAEGNPVNLSAMKDEIRMFLQCIKITTPAPSGHKKSPAGSTRGKQMAGPSHAVIA